MSDAVSADRRDEIERMLRQLAAEEEVMILHAVESGSRAWGFHSEDSDYDVRFIYARPIDWHLGIETGRDVIERPISADLDISGWDLRKTFGLILRSNAVALEWLRSPIEYHSAPGFRDDMLGFCAKALRRKPMLWHYLRLAERQNERMRDGNGAVRLKKLLYVLRPALALRWLRLRNDQATPPMDMATLIGETDPPAAAVDEIAGLIDLKRGAGETGTMPEAPPEIAAMIDAELSAARAEVGLERPEPRVSLAEEADRRHVLWVRHADAALTRVRP